MNAAGLTSADALTERHQRCQLRFVSFAIGMDGNGSPQGPTALGNVVYSRGSSS